MTNVLTDEEIRKWWSSENGLEDCVMCKIDDFEKVVRAIEAAVIRKLAAGVSVEPYATLHHDDGYFTTKQREHDLRYSGPMRTEVVTLDQLTTAIAAARVAENEQ